jgi:hypothetical protein
MSFFENRFCPQFVKAVGEQLATPMTAITGHPNPGSGIPRDGCLQTVVCADEN